MIINLSWVCAGKNMAFRVFGLFFLAPNVHINTWRLYAKITKHPKKLYHINHHGTIYFFITSVQVILVPFYCIFCVLSNAMLNVSIDTFS